MDRPLVHHLYHTTKCLATSCSAALPKKNERQKVEEWFHERQIAAENIDNEVTTNIVKRLTEASALSEKMHLSPINSLIYSVKNVVHSFVVDLAKRTCTCRAFLLDLLSCPHAIKAISKANQSVYNMCYYYKIETLHKLYAPIIMPVAHPKDWNVLEMIRLLVVKAPLNPRQAN